MSITEETKIFYAYGFEQQFESITNISFRHISLHQDIFLLLLILLLFIAVFLVTDLRFEVIPSISSRAFFVTMSRAASSSTTSFVTCFSSLHSSSRIWPILLKIEDRLFIPFVWRSASN